MCPVDPACPKLNQYLMASMGSLQDEVLRVLFLDAGHRLIADEQLHNGSVRHLELYPRTIFRRAMEHGATGLILAHNHPSGDAAPSETDILATRRLSEIGHTLDIEIIDHIVVTASRVYSMGSFAPERSDTAKVRPHILRDSFGTGEQPVAIALENARRARQRRRYRTELIGAEELFGDPAWDMLITVFIHGCEGTKIAMNDLCRASCVSPSGALRRVHKLCEAKILTLIADPYDGRRHFVELTPEATQSLTAYFSERED